MVPGPDDRCAVGHDTERVTISRDSGGTMFRRVLTCVLSAALVIAPVGGAAVAAPPGAASIAATATQARVRLIMFPPRW